MSYMRYLGDSGPAIGRQERERVVPVSAATLVEALAGKANDEGEPMALDQIKMLPAADDGGKILCVALNYVDHAKEAEQPVPESPIIFFKSREAMIAAGDKIASPHHITQLDYEGELALVIGKAGYNIHKDDAWGHIAGLTPFNDISARNLFKVKAGQAVHLDWFSGKCLERSTPIGPSVVPTHEILDSLKSGSVKVRTLVNGEVRQDAEISDMIFDIPTLVAFASSRVSLSPGDIIATGTPPGVGAGTGRFLSSGDVVRVEISGLSTLENTVE
jgi:acylpyruvate hydrolase